MLIEKSEPSIIAIYFNRFMRENNIRHNEVSVTASYTTATLPKNLIINEPDWESFLKADKFNNKLVDYIDSGVLPILLLNTYYYSMYKLSFDESSSNEYFLPCIYTGDQVKVPEKLTELIFNFIRNKDYVASVNYLDDPNVKNFMNEINEEHIVPSSIYKKCFPMVIDLHNVYPCRSLYNSFRANLKYSDYLEYSGALSAPKKFNLKLCSGGKKYPLPFIGKGTYSSPFEPECAYISMLTHGAMHDYGDIIGTSKTDNFKLKDAKRFYNSPEGLKLTGGETYFIQNAYSCNFNDCFLKLPKNAMRGLIARSILYFHAVYKVLNPRTMHSYLTRNSLDSSSDQEFLFKHFNNLYDQFMDKSTFDLMCYWHLKYAPSKYEIMKNQRVYGIQGNENMFIKETLDERMGALIYYFGGKEVVDDDVIPFTDG